MATHKPTKKRGLTLHDQEGRRPYKSNAHAIAQALAHCF